ncbi:hypothetical protein NA57DRAFT_76795 [Rhizodiscina lignyota]|uniref:Uncharacterized protein n=1 Tax=Rhizodiscina lignyota TaxID=1504668 RepID=A0A9P4IGX1_9PEZI|nr:hypothetical protein NA57DRAFT_76795 [Rhizodiscina lignyota]
MSERSSRKSPPLMGLEANQDPSTDTATRTVSSSAAVAGGSMRGGSQLSLSNATSPQSGSQPPSGDQESTTSPPASTPRLWGHDNEVDHVPAKITQDNINLAFIGAGLPTIAFPPVFRIGDNPTSRTQPHGPPAPHKGSPLSSSPPLPKYDKSSKA